MLGAPRGRMTARGRLSADVRRLIAEQLHSIGALDLLMLMHAEPERWWTVEEVCAALQCPPRWAALHLEDLHDGGLLGAEGNSERRYAFQPRGERIAAAADALADAYVTRRRDVVKFIFAMPSPELDAFSEAFRIRRDEEG